MDEFSRKLVDLSLSCAEKRMSTQTEYIHLKYHALQEEIQYTIPIIENFLYALTLFRTRSVENITKAKIILEKLLFFQTNEGNFPVYLHEYPECKDYYTAIRLLAPIYWIIHGYHQVLGAELKIKLETVLLKLLENSLKILDEKKINSNLESLIIASTYATGKLLDLKEIQEKGEKLLENFKIISKDIFIPKHLGDFIVASQMVNPNLEKSFITGFFEHLCKTWDTKLSTYIGPSLHEYQSEFEPIATFYDLAMGYFTKKFSKRALKDASFHLQAVLIQEMEDPLLSVQEPEINGTINNQSYSVIRSDCYSYAFMEQSQELNPSQDKGFSPFKLRFGGADRLHTFVIEGGNSKKITMEKNGENLEFFFTLSQLPELEDKQEAREVIFYFDLLDKSTIHIEGIKATTFQINEKVDVLIDGFKCSLSFEVVEGSGQFMGHYMRGNRPSQIANKGIKRFEAYDSQLFLRTLRRSEECVIKVKLSLI